MYNWNWQKINIIECALTRRPIKSNPKSKNSQITAFTNKDFKKYEEYFFE